MKASFNVLDRGWIPVVCEDGTRKLLGIRQALAQAHELREISDPSPLDEYSLYRFLGLFLMDALRPGKKSSIRALLQEGKFDMTQIEAYIAQCQSEGVSFDLFDEKRPFLQSEYDSNLDGKEKPVSALDCTMPSGNNHTHFIHALPGVLSVEQAAKKLLTSYWFCTAGAQGYPSGVYGAPPYFGVIHETTLFGTLMDLMIPTDTIGVSFDDPPVLWRRTQPIGQKIEVGQTSWLQGMLFPTRRIHLNPNENGEVASVFLSQGENYSNKESWRDPCVTYRSNDTSVFPLRPHADAPIWRNVCDILDIPGDHASQTLNLYRSLHGGQNVCMTLYGVETSQASYLSIQRHDLRLPLSLAEDDRIDLLKTCVQTANQLCKALRKALESVEAIPKLTVSSAVLKQEAECEKSFWQLCTQADCPSPDLNRLYANYVSDLCRKLGGVYDETLSSLHLRAHTLAAAEEGRRSLNYEIQKLKKGAEL